MELDYEVLKNGLATVEKCLKEVLQKKDLTPAEQKAALDGMELREWLLAECDNCKMENEYSERGYSGHDTPYRRYNITAYGPRTTSRMYSDRSYGMMDPYYYENRNSGDYGVQGWYRSGHGPYMDDPMYYGGVPGNMPHGSVSTRGYSRHSIGDRVVEKLEHMMDTTESDYEREELHKFIRMIRQAAD